MKPNRFGSVTLEHPHDMREFTHAGVCFRRLSGLHELGRYDARVLDSGRRYSVIGGNSKRYPWKATALEPTRETGNRAGTFPDLPRCAEGLALFDRTKYSNRSRSVSNSPTGEQIEQRTR